MAVGARRWDAVALLVDPGGWPVLVCQLARAVRRGSGAGPAQGAPERCAGLVAGERLADAFAPSMRTFVRCRLGFE